MNICFLLGRLHKNGGIGRATTILANTLCKDPDIKVHLLCYSDRKQGIFYNIEPEIKQSYLLNEHCNLKKAMLKGAHKKLRKYIRDNNIDVLVGCGTIFFPLCVMAVRKTNTKCVCWEHSNLRTADNGFEGICRKISAKKADLIVTLTKCDKNDYLAKFKNAKVTQVYNSIDPKVLSENNHYDPDTNKIISVGRLNFSKYYEKAVEVATIVLPKFPEYTWSIYGNGEDEEKLRALIKQAGLQDRLILEGQVSNIYDLYKNHSLLVMTSRYEGFPMVLLEGLGKNLPLVAFDIFTGPNEIIHNGENGYLIEPFDADKMAEKICELLNNRDLRIKMSENCKKYVGEFEHSDIVRKWKEIFIKVTNS